MALPALENSNNSCSHALSCFVCGLCSFSILYGGAKAHTASLARAFLNDFLAVKQLHAEHRAATHQNKRDAALTRVSLLTAGTAAENMHHSLLYHVCCDLPNLQQMLT